jgi:hypothetical protein
VILKKLERKAIISLYNPNYINNVKEYRNSNKALIIVPKDQTLVQGDSFTSGNFYIKPKVGEGSEVRLNWKLLSRTYGYR